MKLANAAQQFLLGNIVRQTKSNQTKPKQRSAMWALAQVARAPNLMALCYFVNDCPIAWRDYVSTITSHLFIRHVHQKIGYRELS
jgi:hypothetical protein